MTRRIAPILVIIGIAVLVGLASASPCGSERSAVKRGLDPEARDVNTAPVPTTIAELTSLPRPHNTAHRAPAELTVWRIRATITAVKVEDDGDYHLVVADGQGRHMIVEIPSVACAAGGPWAKQIEAARDAAQHALHPGTGLRRVAVPAVIVGVGFYDYVHGQTGVAPNGVELHPALQIEIGGGV